MDIYTDKITPNLYNYAEIISYLSIKYKKMETNTLKV